MNYTRLAKLGIALAVLLTGLMASSVLAGTPSGAGPYDSLRVTGAWQTIAPNTRLWFYFDYGGDRSKIEIALDAYGANNLPLAVFTPDQAKAWLPDPTTAPVGLGMPPTTQTAAAIHDLVWVGAFNFPGRFFAVVTNNNPAPLSFRLTVSGAGVMLAPAPTPTPLLWFLKTPLATPIPAATLQGKIVFQDASGGNIYTVNGDGTNLTRITYGLDPAWSPDGGRIAFSRWDEPAGLFIANADGSNAQRIFGAPQLLSSRWSPDGTRIAFTRQQGGTLEDRWVCVGRSCFTAPADPFWKLGIVDVASGALTEPACTRHCFAPTWSDNHTLVYADAGYGILRTDTLPPVRVVSEDGTVETLNPISTLFSQNPKVQSAAASPDGRQIAFQAVQHDHWEIVVMNADGRNPISVARPTRRTFQVVNDVAPTWSPDGKHVLFLSDRNGKWEFFLADADGSNLRQVLKNVTDTLPIQYNFSNERVIDWVK